MRYGKCSSYPLLLLLIAALAVSSCRKENGIDNNKVVLTPYGVFFGDKVGLLQNTNDGLSYRTFNSLKGDGAIMRSIIVSAENIILIKKNLFVSDNNGLDFNQGKGSAVNPTANWASMILDVPGFGTAPPRIYLASTVPNGVQYSEDHGVTWTQESTTSWGSITGANVSSFAYTPNGFLFGMDQTGANLYLKHGSLMWNQSANATGLPNGIWYLSSFNNTVLAIDRNGAGGVQYSNDTGLTWTKYAGIPGNQQIYACSAPLGQTLLAGTDSAGVYRLSGGVFVQSNNGLKPFTSVYGITGKQDTYKNGIIKRYVYIATNFGLYRSEDLGQNWVLAMPGDFRTIW